MPSTLPVPSLAALAEYPSVGDSLIFQLNGLIVVFLALGSIWLTLELTGAFFRRRAAATVGAAPALPAPVAGSNGTADAVTLAAIAAAVHIALDARPHRISAISPAPAAPDWAREGRREIFSSHRVR